MIYHNKVLENIVCYQNRVGKFHIFNQETKTKQ